MADPSAQVAPPLLTHLHCLSKMPYPPIATLAVEMVGDLLLRAPAAVQQHPFQWTMLDTPGDGSLFLVWVPPMLNGGCASDGFVWVDVDQGYSMELPKGYVSWTSLFIFLFLKYDIAEVLVSNSRSLAVDSFQ